MDNIHIGEYAEAGEYTEGGYFIQMGEEYKDYESEEEWEKAQRKFQDEAHKASEVCPGLCSSVYEEYAFISL